MIYKKVRIKFPGIGKRFKTIMEFKNISQKEFSGSLGVEQSNISQIVNEISNPSTSIIKFISFLYSINEKWLLTGEGRMERKAGNGNGVGEEVRKDQKLFDIVQILKADQEIKDAVYDFLVANKGLERATKFVRSVVSKKVEKSLAAEISEDPKISDIVKLLKKNPETKDTILQLLETDMEIIRSLMLLKKHLKGNRSGILSKNPNSIYF